MSRTESNSFPEKTQNSTNTKTTDTKGYETSYEVD